MLPCHSCYTYVTWMSKKVGDLKSSHGRKGGHATKGGKGGELWGGFELSASLSQLPTYSSLF